MIKSEKIPISIIVIIGISAFSCSTYEPDTAPSSISFLQDTIVFQESDMEVHIGAKLDEVQFSYVESRMEAKYLTPQKDVETGYDKKKGNLVINGGYIFGTYALSVTDDEIRDGNDTIDIQMSVARGNAKLYPEFTKVTMIIVDDEQYGSEQMNIHLSWTSKYGHTGQSNIDFNVGLYLVYDVIFDNGYPVSYKVEAASDDLFQFQDIFVTANSPDRDYYVLIKYNSNISKNPDLSVDVSSEFSGFGYSDESDSHRSEGTLLHVGDVAWIGPCRKNGNSFIVL